MKKIIFCLIVLFIVLFPIFASDWEKSFSIGMIDGESFCIKSSGFSYYALDREPGFQVSLAAAKGLGEILWNEFRISFKSFSVEETYYSRDHLWDIGDRDLEEERFRRKGKYNYLFLQYLPFFELYGVRFCPVSLDVSYRDKFQLGWSEMIQINLFKKKVSIEAGFGILYSLYKKEWNNYWLKSSIDATDDFNFFVNLGWRL